MIILVTLIGIIITIINNNEVGVQNRPPSLSAAPPFLPGRLWLSGSLEGFRAYVFFLRALLGLGFRAYGFRVEGLGLGLKASGLKSSAWA